MRYLKIILAFVFIALVIVLISQLLRQRSGYTISQTPQVPNTFSTAVSFSHNSLVFSNGRSFVKYNYHTGSTTLLSSDDISDKSLSSIDSLSVSADHNYLVFHDGSYSKSGVLYDELKKEGLPLSPFGYWWVYNISSQSFAPLPSGVIMAKTFNNKVFALSYNRSTESISTLNFQTLEPTDSVDVSGINNFFPTRNGYILQTPDNKLSFTNNGSVFQNISNSMIINGVTNDGNSAIGTSIEGDTHQLVKLDVDSLTSDIVVKNISNVPVWLDSGRALFQLPSTNSGTSQLGTYDITNSKRVAWKFPNSPKNFPVNLNLNALVGQNTAIVAKTGKNYMLGNGLSALNLPGSNYSKNISVDGKNITVGYASSHSPQPTTFFVTVSSGKINVNDSEQSAIYRQLRSDGYNPLLFNFQLN